MVWTRDILRRVRGSGSGRVQEAGEAKSAEQRWEGWLAIQGWGTGIYSLIHREVRCFLQGWGAWLAQLAREGCELLSLGSSLGGAANICGGGGGHRVDSGWLGGAGGGAGCVGRGSWGWGYRLDCWICCIGWFTRSWLIYLFFLLGASFCLLVCILIFRRGKIIWH